MLNDKKNIIFTKEICPYCVKAKALLERNNIQCESLMLDIDVSKEEMINLVLKREGVQVNTVPQIFIEGKYIGGYDDLVAFFERRSTNIDLDDFEL